MGEVEEFNTLAFEKKLMQLKDTQESIQSLSSWCLKQREHHKKIVSSWLNVLKRVKIEQRLVLFYLANDVIQYSKRKNYEFVESWGLNLQKATPLVRDEKVRPKILRIFKIWEQRSVYDNEFLSDLTGLLSAGAVKKTDDDSLDFQPQQLVNKIKQCSVLEADTDLRLKYIHESHLELSDADALCANLKDRSNKDDVEKELNEGIACVERYTQALQREIVAREALLALLQTANQYYSTQRGEVKVVAYAYKNFGARVRALKRKLDELIPTLPEAAPSPPQRDEDVPSPGPDEDLELPVNEGSPSNDISYNIDRTFNTSITADGSLYNMGLSSFLSSENPMALFNESSDPNLNSSANRIEVINNRPSEKQDFNINDFLKTLVPNENSTASDNNSVVSGSLSQKSQDALPGLDLLSDAPNPPPPTSFYGTLNEDPEPYHPETPQWNNSWSLPPAPVPPVTMPVSMPPPVPTPPSLPPTSLPMPSLPLPPALPSMPSMTMPSLPPTLPSSMPSLASSMPSLASFASPPASPPPAPPPPPHPVPIVPVYSHNTQDMSTTDVDHRGILPPPPPPPVLPLLGNMEDVDQRMLPAVPPPTAPQRHAAPHQDVDHRNLISLTQNAPPVRDPRGMSNNTLDQDYRVPPMIPPSDIVESVDMDLSEDEDQHMYQSQNDHSRRHSFNNNNKVLVGGDNGKTNHNDHTNLIQINSTQQFEKKEAHSAPIVPSMGNPFNNMPLKTFSMPNMQNAPPNMQHTPPNMQNASTNMQNAPPNMQNAPSNMNAPLNMQNAPPTMQNMPPNMQNALPNMQNAPPNMQNAPPSMQNAPPNMQNAPPNMQNTPPIRQNAPNIQFPKFPTESNFAKDDDDDFDEDMRSLSQIEQFNQLERHSPEFEGDWQQNRQFNNPNQRFPRNWGPRTNFRPQFGPQFWPRNGPRPPLNRWMGPPRPQRFW